MNLRQARLAKGLTQRQVAAHIGINQNTYSYWETGRSRVDTVALPRLAALFGVSADYLLGNAGEETPKGVKIPVLGRVAAGIPIEAVEDILDYEEISPHMAAQGEFFALQVKGRSMEPRMQEGDIIICKKQADAETGDVAVVLVNGDDATVKKIKKTSAGLYLLPTNPAFDPLFYTYDEVMDRPVTIIGKVVELRAKY